MGQRLKIWKDVHGRHSPWEDILLKNKGKEREYKTCSDLKGLLHEKDCEGLSEFGP